MYMRRRHHLRSGCPAQAQSTGACEVLIEFDPSCGGNRVPPEFGCPPDLRWIHL